MIQTHKPPKGVERAGDQGGNRPKSSMHACVDPAHRGIMSKLVCQHHRRS